MPPPRHDLIILGGGLAGGLAALAVKQARPGIDLVLVERGAIGGNHLWSFFASDVDAAGAALVEPLIAQRWPGYEVRFPAHRRRLAQPYHTIESERLDAAIRALLPAAAIVAGEVSAATPTLATLRDGRTIEAKAVLDARGFEAAPVGLNCGWQKFVGQMLDVPAGHGLTEPIVMDATVDQAEGYRFVYALPFSPTSLFVEDTYYGDEPTLDRDALSGRIADWAKAQGMTATSAGREESGVLPVVTGGDFGRFWPASDTIARAGVRAGLFHPLTSFSLPDAVRFATWLAQKAPLDDRLGQATRGRAKAHWRSGWFDRLLARMLFKAAGPRDRYRILQRYYALPAPLIARFYAGRSTWADRARVLIGRPPVPIPAALRVILARS